MVGLPEETTSGGKDVLDINVNLIMEVLWYICIAHCEAISQASAATIISLQVEREGRFKQFECLCIQDNERYILFLLSTNESCSHFAFRLMPTSLLEL